jgi:hypothetical protein
MNRCNRDSRDTWSELGARHLGTRSNLAFSRGEAGGPVGAAAAFEALITDQLRVLGPDHPNTTRSYLARWRGEAGDPAGATTAYEALLTDQLRILGPDHPDTLTTRSNLAYWQGQAGDPAGATTAYEALLTDQLRILGRLGMNQTQARQLPSRRIPLTEHTDLAASVHPPVAWRLG